METCHDCKKEIAPGQGYEYKTKAGTFYKCASCREKAPSLQSFQPCEVFTRTVGYIRPRQQMNPGKLAEVEMRKNLNLTKTLDNVGPSAKTEGESECQTTPS